MTWSAGLSSIILPKFTTCGSTRIGGIAVPFKVKVNTGVSGSLDSTLILLVVAPCLPFRVNVALTFVDSPGCNSFFSSCATVQPQVVLTLSINNCASPIFFRINSCSTFSSLLRSPKSNSGSSHAIFGLTAGVASGAVGVAVSCLADGMAAGAAFSGAASCVFGAGAWAVGSAF